MKNQLNQLFSSTLVMANVGLEVFYQAAQDQNIPSIHVEWKPAAGGNPRLMEILEKLKNR